eukprot:4450437-Amphidinium_carterae.1
MLPARYNLLMCLLGHYEMLCIKNLSSLSSSSLVSGLATFDACTAWHPICAPMGHGQRNASREF